MGDAEHFVNFRIAKEILHVGLFGGEREMKISRLEQITRWIESPEGDCFAAYEGIHFKFQP